MTMEWPARSNGVLRGKAHFTELPSIFPSGKNGEHVKPAPPVAHRVLHRRAEPLLPIGGRLVARTTSITSA